MKNPVHPRLLYADQQGNIFDHPELLMLCKKGKEVYLPRQDELIPLPKQSDVFFLPQRDALGFNPADGKIQRLDAYPVSAFVCPGHTITGITAFKTNPKASPLPLYAYAAIGFAKDRFWVCAKQVDKDQRQNFAGISDKPIQQGVSYWRQKYPNNRLVRHLSKCALTYSCPAAKNLFLGRYEAPLPTAKSCNAACIGCISWQPEGSNIPITQQRINFTPTSREITQIMFEHTKKEKHPIFSFGQGCEGEPLTEGKLIKEAISSYRKQNNLGTININSNGSLPLTIIELASSGLSSIRITLNSAREKWYTAYHHPKGYIFEDVKTSIKQAKDHSLFVSLNYLFYPGINDTEDELSALFQLIAKYKIDFIQFRNLNIDPEIYISCLPPDNSPIMGLPNFQRRLKKEFPWLQFGYFNPYLEND